MRTYNVVWEERMSVNVQAESEKDAIEMIHGSEYDESQVSSEISSYPEAFDIRGGNCPLCGNDYSEYPALSRVLSEDICPNCGTREALIPQTEQGFKDLWSTAKRIPEGALEKIVEHFKVK